MSDIIADSAVEINGVQRPDFVPNPQYAHHSYSVGTYEWAGEKMCSVCGRPPGAIVHDSAPRDDDASVDEPITEEVADAPDALPHLKNALQELVSALNADPTSFNIANAILYMQDAFEACENNCAMTEAATVTYQKAFDAGHWTARTKELLRSVRQD